MPRPSARRPRAASTTGLRLAAWLSLLLGTGCIVNPVPTPSTDKAGGVAFDPEDQGRAAPNVDTNADAQAADAAALQDAEYFADASPGAADAMEGPDAATPTDDAWFDDAPPGDALPGEVTPGVAPDDALVGADP